MYSVSDETRKPIFEGVQGENEAREIQFDVTAWVEELGEGVCTATAKRPTDTTPYPVTVTRSGNVVTWKPNSVDTAIEGVGAFQLEYSINDSIAKTRIWNTKIAPSLDPAGDPPDPYDNWLAEMREIAADAIQAAQDAEQSAQDAAASATEAGATVSDVKSDVKTIYDGGFERTYSGTDLEVYIPVNLTDFYESFTVAHASITYSDESTSFFVGQYDSNRAMIQQDARKYGSQPASSASYNLVSGTAYVRIVYHSTVSGSITLTATKRQSIDSVEDLVDRVVAEYIVEPVESVKLWKQGGIISTSGASTSDPERARVDNLDGVYTIKASAGYSVLLYGWDSSNVYQGYVVGNTLAQTGAVWQTEYNMQDIYQLFPDHTFKLVARKNDNSAVSPYEIYDKVDITYPHEIAAKLLAKEYELSPTSGPIFIGANGLMPAALLCDFTSRLGAIYDLQGCTSDNDGNVYVVCHKGSTGYVMKIAPNGTITVNTKQNFMLHGISATYDADNDKLILSSREGASAEEDRMCYIYDFDSNTVDESFEYPAVSDLIGMFVYKIGTDQYLMFYSDLESAATLYVYIYNKANGTMALVSNIQTEYKYIQDADIVGDYAYCVTNNGVSDGKIIMFNWRTGVKYSEVRAFEAEVEGFSVHLIGDSVYSYTCSNSHDKLYRLKLA